MGLAPVWAASMGCSITLDPTFLPVDSNRSDSGEEVVRSSNADASTDAIPSPPLDATEASPADAHESTGDRTAGVCVSVVGPENEYLICTEPLVESAAAAECMKRSALLATIKSAKENAFIDAQLLLYADGNVWLGGTRDDNMLWSWPDGSSFWIGRFDGAAAGGSYTNWKSGEPNDSSTVTNEPEQCMVMTLTDGGWNDRTCSLALEYICQRPLHSP
jgi:Lectin C-type domain